MTETSHTQSVPGFGAGFADPVHDAQRVFRAVMAAMAEPGRRIALPAAPAAPAALPGQLAALALALADFETPVWLGPDLTGHDDVARYLKFFAGTSIVADPEAATFALVTDAAAMPPLTAFAQGSLEYPDRSATLLIAVSSLDDGPALTFHGPGIQKTASLAPQPQPMNFRDQLVANRALFPRGVDIVLATSTHVAALPRSIRIVEED